MTCSRRCRVRSAHGASLRRRDALGPRRGRGLTDAAGSAALTALQIAVRTVPGTGAPEEPRSVLGVLAAEVYGRPSEPLTRDRGDRHLGQDHHHLSGGGRAARGRTDRGADRHGRHAHRRRRGAQRADHPGGPGAAGAAGGDGRAWRGHRGDGGVQPRAVAGPGRRCPVRGGRVHQSLARPSGFPPDDGRLLRGQGPAVRSGVAGARADRGDLRRRRGGRAMAARAGIRSRSA